MDLQTHVSYSPLQLLEDPVLAAYGLQLYLKREDLLHPDVSGNKWRKLKYNLQEATNQQKSRLLTFGGAYSNHIYATAAAGRLFGFETIGVIRGEETLPLNSTLSFALACGMHLHYVDRQTYAHKYQWEFLDSLSDRFGDFYLLPEGGTNALAVKGCSEIIPEIEMDDSAPAYDYICCCCGTGGTLAGLVASLPHGKKALGFSSLKGGDFLSGEVKQVLKAYRNAFDLSSLNAHNFQLITDYHFGGYAKTTPELIRFIQNFEHQHGILLDQVYTGKMMAGLYDMIQQGKFQSGQTIIALHTGGIQGRSEELGEEF
jgi:1-aminocyclopropane-1-carboxylate deaminase